MKQLITLILSGLLGVCLTACGDNKKPATPTNPEAPVQQPAQQSEANQPANDQSAQADESAQVNVAATQADNNAQSQDSASAATDAQAPATNDSDE